VSRPLHRADAITKQGIRDDLGAPHLGQDGGVADPGGTDAAVVAAGRKVGCVDGKGAVENGLIGDIALILWKGNCRCFLVTAVSHISVTFSFYLTFALAQTTAIRANPGLSLAHQFTHLPHFLYAR
jgi:hypothetical protein